MFTPKRIAVLADDFTGAGDVALAFEKTGFSSEITVLDGYGFPGRLPRRGVRVWVMDTETRTASDSCARKNVHRALELLDGWQPDFVYKKIDSTLRGPVSAELEVFLAYLRKRGLKNQRVAFVPAFPGMARTTKNGFHFVNGVLLNRTAFARDPRHKIKTAYLPALCWFHGRSLMEEVWIPDVVSQKDVARCADRLAAGRDVFTGGAVGSAGLAEELAGRWQEKRKHKEVSFPCRSSGSRLRRVTPVLAVIGSAHPRSREQARELKKRYKGSLSVLKEKIWQSSLLMSFSNSAKTSLSAQSKRGKTGTVSMEKTVFVLQAPLRRGSSPKILRELVDRAVRFAKNLDIRRFVVTGGETACALVRRIRCLNWRIAARVDRGVPLCVPAPQPGGRVPAGMFLVLKPGGFGDKDVLIKSVRLLQHVE